MSYTLTIESPDLVSWFEKERSRWTAAELGELFIQFLSSRLAQDSAKKDNPFTEFCGSWDDHRFEEFQEATRRVVNPMDWQ